MAAGSYTRQPSRVGGLSHVLGGIAKLPVTTVSVWPAAFGVWGVSDCCEVSTQAVDDQAGCW
jgi:hypothetical protein